MPDVDALLIDKLWQPLADRLGDRLSCFDLARLSLKGKQSFFEKDQKTSDRLAPPPSDKSFLLLFFKKEEPSFRR